MLQDQAANRFNLAKLEVDPAYYARLHVSGILQTSLDPLKVLKLFYTELKNHIPYDGAKFICREKGQISRFGKMRPHVTSFFLGLNDNTSLGEISIYRSSPFTVEEQAQIENLARALVYPLRNALLYDKAKQDALKDQLTQTNNRSALDTILPREISLAERHRNDLSILVMDIDFFKSINDRYGHARGDVVLKEFVSCVYQCARRTDMLFRYGGEEFVLVLSNTGLKGAKRLAERIRKAVKQSMVQVDDYIIKYTVSIGVSALQDGDDYHSLFNRADAAMYCAKAQGRNRTQILEQAV